MSLINTVPRSRAGVLPFLVLTFTGAWVAMLPLWFSGFRRTSAAQGASPLAMTCLVAMMLVPALAAIALTARAHGLRGTARVLGLSRAQPWHKELGFAFAAIALPLALTGAGLVLAT